MPLAESRELTEAGPGGRVNMSRVLAVGKWESAPIRRAARKAKTEGRLIDLTYGYACKWALFLDSGHMVLATAILDAAPSEGDEQIPNPRRSSERSEGDKDQIPRSKRKEREIPKPKRKGREIPKVQRPNSKARQGPKAKNRVKKIDKR